jgi:hypothetical protein
VPNVPTRLKPILAVLASLGGLAAASAAQAAPFANVVAAVKNQTRIIRTSPAEKGLGQVRLDTPAHARAALPVLTRLHGVIAYAAADVSHASTQSPVQRSARRKWVTGARDQADGIAQFELAARAVIAGSQARARPHLLKGLKLLVHGAVATNQADSLLDLAHNTRAPRIHGA